MMYFASCTRRQFVDFIVSRKTLTPYDVQSSKTIEGILVLGEDIVLVWRKSPADKFSFPCAVIVAEDSVLDFFAWVSTYFRHMRPFTAHCRVLTPSLVRLLEKNTQSLSLPDMRSADIGLVLAEGIAYSADHTDYSRIPPSAFSRTLSFAYAKGVTQYSQVLLEDGPAFDQIQRGWLSVRKLSNQSTLELTPTSIHEVWEVVRCATSTGRIRKGKSKTEQLVMV